MKKTLLLLILLSVFATAQQAAPPAVQATNLVERPIAPSYSDLYCSGFISKQNFGGNVVAGGRETPDTTMFSQGDTIFLNGAGFQENQRYAIIRMLKDPNQFEPFTGARKVVAETGQPYGEIGRVRVVQLKAGRAIATVEFSCQAILPGDLVIPFQEKQTVSYRKEKVIFSLFPSEPSGITAQIVMAKDFDMFLAAGHKAYLNAGSEKGVKVGDYFRVVRGYDPKENDPAAALSYSAPAGDDSQKQIGKYTKTEISALPTRALGEMIVLSVTPTSATAMVTFATESIKVGDKVELEAARQ